MAKTVVNYSDFTKKASALIGVPYSSMTDDERTFLQTFFSNQINNIWDDNNWMDICPYGEARFAGDLLTYPNDLSKTAYWNASALTATANSLPNPADGRTTASKCMETTANAPHYIYQNYNFIPSVTYQYSAYVRCNGTPYISLTVDDGGGGGFQGVFNVQTGTLFSSIGTPSALPQQPSIVQQNNGFWLCTVYFTTTDQAGTSQGSAQMYLSQNGTTFSYAGSATHGVYSWGQVLLQTSFADPSSICIPYDQTGESEIDVVYEVWKDSPIGAIFPRPQAYSLNPDSIQIIGPFGYATFGIWYSAFPNGYSPSQFPVYIYYRKQMPNYDGDDYDATVTYAVDDQILFESASGVTNYYKCTTATAAGESPSTTPSKWEVLEIPGMFLMFVVYGAFADWLRMDGQLEKAAAMDAMADDYRIQEADKMERQEGWLAPSFKVQSHLTSRPAR